MFFPDIHREEQNTKMEQIKQRAEMTKSGFIPTKRGIFDIRKNAIIPGTEEENPKLDPYSHAFNINKAKGQSDEQAAANARKSVADMSLEGKIDNSRLYPILNDKDEIEWTTKDNATGKRKPKEVTDASLKELSNQIHFATLNGKEPSQSEVMLINKLAKPAGLEFRQVNKTVPGFFGTTKEVSTWDLVPINKGATTTNALRPKVGTMGIS